MSSPVERANRNREAYIWRVRAGILHAIGAFPIERHGAATAIQRRIELKGPEFYRLKRVPHLSTIRAVIKLWRAAESEPRPGTWDALYAAIDSTRP